jgi:glycosyltransferase involved in cell wall biosynthesis
MMVAERNGRVAVIVPAYRATFLAEALESVFTQSRPADEVIVVNDGSPDRTELMQAIAPYAGRLTLLSQENLGAGAARNHGLRATTAEFIGLLDADDRWLPSFLAEQLGVLRSSSTELDLVYTDGLLIGQSPLAGRTFMSTCPSADAVTLERLLSQECTVLLSSVVARRAAIVAVGGFDESLRRGQDFDLWLRMARNGARMRSRPVVLAQRRVHGDNLSGTTIDQIERPLRVFEKTLTSMPLTEQERDIVLRRVRLLTASLARERGKELLRNGDFPAARLAFDEARRGLQAWKLHATALGLRVAPHLVRRLYLSRAASAPS